MNQTQTTAARESREEQLQEQIKRMQQLVRNDGFIKAYFDALDPAKSNIDAFEIVNNEYYQYYGYFRYKDHESFRKVLERLKKQNRL